MKTLVLSRIALSFLAVSGTTSCWLTGPSDGEELTAAVKRWERGGPANYEFTLAYSSMVGYRALCIRVMAGQVINVAPLPGTSLQPGDRGKTIPELFEEIRSMLSP